MKGIIPLQDLVTNKANHLEQKERHIREDLPATLLNSKPVDDVGDDSMGVRFFVWSDIRGLHWSDPATKVCLHHSLAECVAYREPFLDDMCCQRMIDVAVCH